MNLKVMKETYLRISYGQGYRFPTIAERYIRLNTGSFGVFENDTLKSETSWNAEVGVKQGFKFFNYFGYIDVALFQQEYKNTIEYLFGQWSFPTQAESGYGFKFLNTGPSRISGIDISISGAAQLAKNITLRTVLGYNYIIPVALDPEYVFAKDFKGTYYTYNNTSLDPADKILKYRFLQTFKGDIQLDVYSFSIGFSAKYFSKIKNLDKSIEDFEHYTSLPGVMLQDILYMDYFKNNNTGKWIFDLRASYQFNDNNELSIISNNFTNNIYSLRPLKAEPMRSVMVQYVLKI
jgi:iron complex outermembrane receptor protein